MEMRLTRCRVTVIGSWAATAPHDHFAGGPQPTSLRATGSLALDIISLAAAGSNCSRATITAGAGHRSDPGRRSWRALGCQALRGRERVVAAIPVIASAKIPIRPALGKLMFGSIQLKQNCVQCRVTVATGLCYQSSVAGGDPWAQEMGVVL